VIGTRGRAQRWSTATHAGREVVPGRTSISRRTCSSAGRERPATRWCSGARTRCGAACRHRSFTRRIARRLGARRARPARRRPRRRVNAEHPGDIVAMLARPRRRRVSSCSPDFGVQGVLDRFGQIARACSSPPTATGTTASRSHPRQRWRRSSTAAVRGAGWWSCPISMPTSAVPTNPGAPRRHDVGGVLAPFASGAIDYAMLPFDHPLYIVYSSGTTGVRSASCTAPAASCSST